MAKETKKAAEPPPPPPKLPPTAQDVLHRNIFLLDKYAETHDARFLSRILRYTKFLRQHLPTAALRAAVDTYVPDAARRAAVQRLVSAAAEKRKEPEAPKPAAAPEPAAAAGAGSAPGAMHVEEPSAGAGASSSASSSASSAAKSAAPAAPAAAATSSAAVKPPKPSTASGPEVEAYLGYVALSELRAQGARGSWRALAEGAEAAAQWLVSYNRRTLDFFSARLAAMHQAAVEGLGAPGAEAALVPALLAAYRTASLRHDEYGQATLLNCVLRAHLRAGAFDSAGKLLAKAAFPEGASPAQLARYLYYRGRVQAVQLDYSDALASLTQAVRKAPPSAAGFRAAATKFAVCAQLLTGEVPDRSTFEGGARSGAGASADPQLAGGGRLAPYLALCSAVRGGDLAGFAAVLAAHGASSFAPDGTLSLVQRLETNVIVTGLRSLALSYSRISFRDVAAKLSLGSAEDAEFLAAKAIRDGVLDAVLDHEGGALTSREAADVYATRAPQEAFHKRIGFCLDVYAEAQRGKRFPPGKSRADLESAEDAARREREEAELASNIEEGAFDDEEDDDDGPL